MSRAEGAAMRVNGSSKTAAVGTEPSTKIDESTVGVVRTCLQYAYNTESDSDKYFAHLMSTPLRHDAEFRRFLPQWLADENRHAAMLADMANWPLLSWDENGLVTRAHSDRPLVASISPALFRLTWLAPDISRAVLLTAAVINEIAAFLGYAKLARMLPDHEYRRTLGSIAGDERRHAERFADFARPILHDSRQARSAATAFVDYAWRPVGANSNPSGTWPVIAQVIFGIEAGTARVPKLDDTVSRLLGLRLRPSEAAARRLSSSRLYSASA